MNERELHGLIEDVRAGKLSRRAFTRMMVGLGLTAPLATQMLAHSGVAVAAEKPVYKPTKRGGGGQLKVLWWQAPTLLNPHFATGTKDQDAVDQALSLELSDVARATRHLEPAVDAAHPHDAGQGRGSFGVTVWRHAKPFSVLIWSLSELRH